jgi:hypothetical protein
MEIWWIQVASFALALTLICLGNWRKGAALKHILALHEQLFESRPYVPERRDRTPEWWRKFWLTAPLPPPFLREREALIQRYRRAKVTELFCVAAAFAVVFLASIDMKGVTLEAIFTDGPSMLLSCFGIVMMAISGVELGWSGGVSDAELQHISCPRPPKKRAKRLKARL